MRHIAAALVLIVATLSSQAALVAGPQRPITPPNLGPSPIERVLDVATDGTDFLTLWSERDDVPRRGMYAGIVTEDGVPRVVPAGPFSGGSLSAQAVWTGDTYLVVYHATDEGPPTVVRMNRDGQIVSEPTVLDVGPGYVAELAWNGTRAFALLRTFQTISGVLLDSRGRVRHAPIQFPVSKAGVTTVTAAGDGFIVAWSEEVTPLPVGGAITQARAARVSPDGEVSEPVELMPPTRTAPQYIAAAASGGEAGIAFVTESFPEPFSHLQRFTVDVATLAVEAHRDFTVLSADGLAVIPAAGGFRATYLFNDRLGSVGFDTTERLSIGLGLNSFRWMNVATNGRTVLAVFGEVTAAAFTLNADATQRKSGPAPVSVAIAHQSNPGLASSGSQMLAAWVEPDSPSGSVLLAQRRNADGNPVDAEPIVVARGYVRDSPAITFTGKVWLVTWIGRVFPDEHVFVKRISPEGVVLDETPTDVGIGWRRALASNGTVTALVMDKPFVAEIRLVRFSPEGTLLDSTPLTAERPYNVEPSIATNGTEFLVTWHEERTRVLGRRLAADATPMDAAPVAIAEGADLSRGGASVASNGTDFVVAYSQWEPIPIYDPPIFPPPTTTYRVFTKRVLRNGTLADTTSEQDGTLLGEGLQPRIAALGSGYVATFIEAEPNAYVTDDRLSLFAVPLNDRGIPTSAPTAVLRNVRSHSNEHSLAVLGSRIEVAYARVAPGLGNAQRVFLRMLR